MNNSEYLRPNPDNILKLIREKESKEVKGKLKIFFGMCAGVGKTYAMLEAAQKAKKEGKDVVLGLIETHKRSDTQNMTNGLENIPLKVIEYRNNLFQEMDLDAILIRKPQLVLIDELAHSNIPGCRHNKRYQDVLEILSHGIDVFTTVNVQHLESRNETVKQITGTKVNETIPDSVFELANEIELIDITPDELLKRLAEGKVYTGNKSRIAIENFFRKGNLTALREMALRLTAERVDRQLREYKSEMKIDGTWKTGLRLLVAIGASPYSADLIRWTRRLAYTMGAKWIAVYVETKHQVPEKTKDLLSKNFNLARELGAEIVSTNDTDIVKGILRVARENNITQIIAGKSRNRGLGESIFKKDIIEGLIETSGDIDVYVVGGTPSKPKSYLNILFSFNSGVKKYFTAAAVVIAVNFLCFIIFGKSSYQTVSLFFLLTISTLPLFNLGAGPILLAALLSALSWNYFFIPPRFTFHISRIEDLIMFVMYFIVAAVAGVLSARIRTQERFVRQREKKTNSLYNLTRDLAEASDINSITEIAIRHIKDSFNYQTSIIFSEGNHLLPEPHPNSLFKLDESEYGYAQWVFSNSQKAGRFTNTLPLAKATYFPLKGRGKVIGVIGIIVPDNEQPSFDQQNLLDTFILQIAVSVERDYLNEAAIKTFAMSESEKLYKTLFNSISHELKTPITAIISASSNINDNSISSDIDLTRSLAGEINIAARRLNSLIENLLDMTRLESGTIQLKLDWHDIKDLIDSTVSKLQEELSGHSISIHAEDNLDLFKFDFALLEQSLINILRNSILYSPRGSLIEVSVKMVDNECHLIISDNGTGFPEDALSRIFDKFYRVPGTKAGGTGLGLSISKGFVEAHSGCVNVSNKNGGGAVFTIKIPMRRNE